MTYRQLLNAIEQATIWQDALSDLQANFPIQGSAEDRDAHQAQVNTIEAALNQQIDE